MNEFEDRLCRDLASVAATGPSLDHSPDLEHIANAGELRLRRRLLWIAAAGALLLVLIFLGDGAL